jgi:hypothetical protein
MPTVYRTTTSTRFRFHRAADCHRIATSESVEAVDLKDLDRAIPCRTCYPDSPELSSLHRYCYRCNTKSRPMPCPHNGGVLVHTVRTRRKYTLVSEPGEVYTAAKYIWPETLHFYAS